MARPKAGTKKFSVKGWRRFLASPPRPGDWSPKSATGLRARCAQLRDHLEARRWATAAELAAVWPEKPEGEKNRETGDGGWQFCYATYARLMGRAEARAELGTGELVLARASANEPVPVPCDDGVTRYVHAKSYHTLRWLTALDRQLAHALAAADDCAGDLRVDALAPLVESVHVRTWLWIITTPGGGLPFDEQLADGAALAEPPASTTAVSARDLVALYRAHRRVNHDDLAILSTLFPTEGGASPERLTLDGFIGAIAHEWGHRVSELTRAWPLRELFAQAVSAARSAKLARDRAEAKAKDGQRAAGPQIIHASS